jgi:hypothetical protein
MKKINPQVVFALIVLNTITCGFIFDSFMILLVSFTPGKKNKEIQIIKRILQEDIFMYELNSNRVELKQAVKT